MKSGIPIGYPKASRSSESGGLEGGSIMAARILSAAYGHELRPLRDLLVELVARALQSGDNPPGDDDRSKAAAEARLAGAGDGDGDPAEYVALLTRSYAAMPGASPPLGPVDSFEPRWTQQQLVERAIALAFRESARPASVLCFGYRKPRPPVLGSGSASGGGRAPQGLECACENSAVGIVASPSWRLLHSRVGDVIMLHVLSHAAVFVPLPSGCFLQILGTPVNECLPTHRKDSASVALGEKMALGRRRPGRVRRPESCNAGPGYRFAEADGSSASRKRGTTGSAEAEVQGRIDYEFGLGGAGRKRRKVKPTSRLLSAGEASIKAGADSALDGRAPARVTRASDEMLAENSSAGRARYRRDDIHGKSRVLATDVHGKRSRGSATADGGHSSSRRLRLRATPVDEKVLQCRNAGNLPVEADQFRHTRSSAIRQEGPSSVNVSKPQSSCSTEHERRNPECGTLSGQNPHHNCRDAHLAPTSCHLPREAADACSAKKKRGRPPSWRRRKLWKVRQSHQEPDGERVATSVHDPQLQQDTFMEVEEKNDGVATEVSHKYAPGQQLRQASNIVDLSRGLGVGEAKKNTSCGWDAIHERPPTKRSSRELETDFALRQKIIDRSPIFYNINFSRRSGLPARHILNVTKANDEGAGHLFSAIFQCNSSMLKPGFGTQFHSVLKLLKQLLSNAKRCAFPRLLGRHCPLPQGFRSQRATESQQQERELREDAMGDKQRGLSSIQFEAKGEDVERITLGFNHQLRAIFGGQLESLDQVNSKTGSDQQLHGSGKVGSSEPRDDNAGMDHKQSNFRTATTQVFGDHRTQTEQNARAGLISCYTDHSKVVGFLWAVCRSVIPQDMLGSFKSWRALRSSIAHFVSLRRHEKFSLQRSLFRLRVSDFSWLAFDCSGEKRPIRHPRRYYGDERKLKQKTLELWLCWVFASLIVPTIRAHFYVTENENQRHTVFYYRKPLWARICSHSFKDLIGKTYKKLTRHAVSQALHSRLFGFSQIRLVPKRNSVRPIANLAASSRGTLKFAFQSQGQDSLLKIFSDLLDGLALGDLRSNDRGALPSSSQTVNHILDEDWTGIRDARDASPPSHFRNDAFPVVRSFVDGSPSSSSASVIASSWTARPKMRSKKTVNFFFRAINSVLKDAHCCLKFEKDTHPEDLGSSVFGYSDIRARVLPFILHLKGSPSGMPKLFMAVCDMTNAYDTIQQEKLNQIAESFVRHSRFKVARYTRIFPAMASTRVLYGRVCTLADKPSRFVDSLHSLANKCSHGIFVEQAMCTAVTREQILTMLQEHVLENVVHIGAHFYRQTVGIPQGSILSSLLCSLFYDHFDVHSLLPLLQSLPVRASNSGLDPTPCLQEAADTRKEKALLLPLPVANATDLTDCDIQELLEMSLEIPEYFRTKSFPSKPPWRSLVRFENFPSDSFRQGIHDPSENSLHFNQMQSRRAVGKHERDFLMLRLIDDTLFISTSKDKARTFIESMHRGSEEYGCRANKRKTSSNFHLQDEKDNLPRNVYATEDGACFMKWSGLLINCCTMEIQADYTRYCGDHISSTLTVRREKNAGQQLVLKMCEYMRPKCHALFFDPRINSPATIGLNAFQAFLLCAMKFHAYVCCLRHLTGSNQRFLYQAINCTISYMFGLLRHKLDDVEGEAGTCMPFKELQWLALVAFHRVLRRKQSRYRILLHMLRTQLQLPKYNKLRFCPHLLSAVDERRSSMFKWIKY